MYKIGDFSQLGQVTVRTLRHYDQLGLLTPGHIDQFTNYRYYMADQLPRLNRILAMRDLGFTLEQIGKLLDAELTVEDMRSLLAERQQEIEQQLREESARLRRVATRLQRIEQDDAPFPYDVVVKSVPVLTLFAIRDTVRDLKAMGEARWRLLTQLYSWIDEAKIVHGQEIVCYHNRSYTMENIDMSIGVEVDPKALLPASAPDNICRIDLPAAPEAASIVHQGSIWEVSDLVSALSGWLGMNGYSSTGSAREIHLFGRELDTYDYSLEELERVKFVYEVLLPAERF